jgi:uncharacterized protein
VIIGARRVGKTTLLRTWYERLSIPRAWLDGDNPAHLQLWERLRTGQDAGSWLTSLTGANPQQEIMLFLDEAQMLPNSSRLVKNLTDTLPALRVMMSGSSALKLQDLTSESMAGRKQLLELYALNLRERLRDPRLTVHSDAERAFSVPGILADMLVWGGFPAMTNLKEAWEKTTYLTDVVDSVLYRDLMSEIRPKDTGLFKRMLVALARSVGSRVNTSNLSKALEITRPTITRYLDLLEQASIIACCPGSMVKAWCPKPSRKSTSSTTACCHSCWPMIVSLKPENPRIRRCCSRISWLLN